MSQLATLRPWCFVLMAIWFLMWGIKRFVSIQNPIYEGIMAVFAIIIGVLLLVTN